MTQKKNYILAVLVFVLSLSCLTFSQSLEDAFNYSGSGLLVQRARLSLTALNISNLTTLEDQSTGLPWQQRYAVVAPDAKGVRITSIEKSKEPFGKYNDAAVPQSNSEGFFSYPNVNLPDEMINLSYTETMFEANVKAFQNTKAAATQFIDMMK